MEFQAAVHRSLAPFIGTCLVVLIMCAGCGEDRTGTEVSLSRETMVQFQKAEKAYRVGAYRVALRLADSIETAAPEFSGVHVLRGQVFSALERYEDASAQLARAAELDPNNPAIHFNWANNAYRREQYREALRRFENVLNMIEDRERVNIYSGDENGREARYAILLQMGRAYDDLGTTDSSRMQFQRAIDWAPERPAAYRALSELHEKLGEFTPALEYARKALERDPDNIEYKYGLGVLLVQSGQYKEAVPYLKAMVEQRSWHHGSHYNLGQAYMHLGREEEAEDYFARADSLQQAQAELEKLGERAELNKGNFQLWIKYGNALRKSGRTEDAIKAFRHALALSPGNIALQNNLAILAVESGNIQEAIMRYRGILQRHSKHPDIWLNLGVAYQKSGQTDKAVEAWQNALKRDPDHATAKKYIAQYGRVDG